MRQRLPLLILLTLFLSQVYAQQSLDIKAICDPTYDVEIFEAYRNDLSGIIGKGATINFDEEDIYFHKASATGILNKYNEYANDAETDVIIVFGSYAAMQVMRKESYAKPTLVFGIVNDKLQGFEVSPKGTSGIHNLAFLNMANESVEVGVFKSIVDYNNLAIITDWRVAEILKDSEYLKMVMDSIDAAYTIISTYDDPDKVAEAIPASVDAILYGPMIGMSEENVKRLVDGINLAGYPTLSLSGGYPDAHSLVFRSSQGDIPQIMRRLALQTESLLNGTNPSEMPVKLNIDYPYVLNMAIASLIDFSPDFSVLQKYKVINRDKVDPSKAISIAEVLDRVVSTNLGIRSAELDYQSFSKEVGLARSQILPYLVASMDGIVTDPNLAEKTLGLNPQYQVSGYLEFSQLVYSELAFSQVRIQKTLRAAADYGYQEQVLDFILEGMEGYLNILRAKANLRIQESNKSITEINLDIAEQRLEVGYSGRSEVYRWESNLANANQDVVAARNQVNQLKVSLNATMNQPLDEEFDVMEANLQSYPFSKYMTESIYSLVHNEDGLETGTSFMVQMAEENLPSVAQIDEQVKAIDQRLGMYRRNRFIPDVSVGGNLTGRFYRGGAGWDPNNPQFFTPAKYFWTVGATASIPIFQGSLNNVRVQQSRIDLELQENEKSRFLQNLEEAIRNQVYEVVIARTNIDFTKDASEAATKALELTQDSYSEGTVSIVELIDAQNNALASELAYINSEYDFLIAVLRLERLTGSFLVLRTEEENQQIINEFLQFENGETNE